MIPSVLASQLEQGVEDFLQTTFPISNPHFNGVLENFFSDPEQMFKGPYISLKLPFKQGSGGVDYFADVALEFPPYLHQEKAFNRLSSTDAKSTIVATGTGSGKTECFMYPLLNYCYQNRDKNGIKAIIIYPMNALANDQAKRFAKLIFNRPTLKGNVSVGLYVGGESGAPGGGMEMSENMVITNRDTIRNSPPDILMTNYKMLDYMLTRPEDFPLWQHNDSETLKYLVVDELHTFDGAQGTDLACLLRRVKKRLSIAPKYLCCIGTSATIGSGDNIDELRQFAGNLYAEPFDEDAVIIEQRQNSYEFYGDELTTIHNVVAEDKFAELNFLSYDSEADYIKAQYRLWFGDDAGAINDPAWQIELGRQFKKHSLLLNILKVMKGQTLAIEELVAALPTCIPGSDKGSKEYYLRLIESLFALIAVALNEDQRPFLELRHQLWMREMKRIVGQVSKHPTMRFHDDLKKAQHANHLPLLHCRDCGALGWAGTKTENDNKLNSDLQHFYNAYFSFNHNVHFLFPVNDHSQGSDDQLGFKRLVCGHCLWLSDGDNIKHCLNCDADDELISVFITNPKRTTKGKVRGSHDCPFCNAQNGLTIIGSQAASLISVMITQLFASTFNDDKKLITFSDSVQDAAHRAGFFTARTYHFNMRGAIQQFVDANIDNGLTLPQLADKFCQYWLKGKGTNQEFGMTTEKFVSNFLAPDMAWLDEYEQLKREHKLPDDSGLLTMVGKRIDWEIYSEYSFRSRIGRTLEKSGASMLSVDMTKLGHAIDNCLETLQNELGGFRELQRNDLERFLVGITAQLKSKGGIFINDLNSYIAGWGGYYTLNNKIYLPYFGRKSRLPSFITDNPRPQRFERLHSGTQPTWHENWALKCFEKYNRYADSYVKELFESAFKALEASNVMEVKLEGDFHIWGLKRTALNVYNSVTQIKCDRCNIERSCPTDDIGLWSGMPCLNNRCRGHYTAVEEKENYYRNLYKGGDIIRINGAEHTGLLERSTREALETTFIEGENAWDTNLISCTPTLEMGIDIGDLSTAILCSVPPGATNYLQRVGRTGRKDGNSLVVTVANAKPHDLYFYAKPEDMFNGKINTPGCYLNAGAVLERQLTAYCFDAWISEGVLPGAVPPKLKSVLNNVKNNRLDAFPNNLLAFIKNNRSRLLDDFIKMFDNMNEAAVNHLNTFIHGKEEDATDFSSISEKILNRLYAIQSEIDSLSEKVKKLNRAIRKTEASPVQDDKTIKELNELKQEKSALNSIIRKIKDKHTYNFFTDEGMLPNYAFPEAGVQLRSVILKKKKDADRYSSTVYEYERAAVSAISELAPYNNFYAEGRKIEIDQIDLSTTNTDEWWRFCNNCNFMENELISDDTRACPKCGSQLWSDNNQKRQMLRLHQVVATMKDRESRIVDDSEERLPIFFNKRMKVLVDEDYIEAAFKIDSEELPFGFEYLRNVTFREVNFGRQDAPGETIDISGEKFPKGGFIICKECGKVNKADDPSKMEHAISCSLRGKRSTPEAMLSCTYLYREFNSEAIRILLPTLHIPGFIEKKQSFCSAILMGLSKTFGGNIDHLQTAFIEEPVIGADFKKEYMVVYDTIPGGTGYLKALIKVENSMPLMEVFEQALKVLKSCSCNNDADKDGCYECLYAYRTSYDIPEISRTIAIELLTQIINHKDKLIEVDRISDINVNKLFDSELEKRFIDSLVSYNEDGIKVDLKSDTVGGKPGWAMQVNNIGYYIEPQKDIRIKYNIVRASRPDFLIFPQRKSKAKPVAVFLDGYKYHADNENQKSNVGNDMAKRIALVQSGEYHVWSLTWDDIQALDSGSNGFYTELLPQRTNAFTKTLTAYKDRLNIDVLKLKDLNLSNSYRLLVDYLADPDDKAWTFYAFLQGMLYIATNSEVDYSEENLKSINSLLNNEPESTELPAFKGSNGQYKMGHTTKYYTDKKPAIQIIAAINKPKLKNNDPQDLKFICRLFDQHCADKDQYKKLWNGFLHLYNVMQFLPEAWFLTSQGIQDDEYTALHEVSLCDDLGKDEPQKVDAEFNELLECFDADIHPFFDLLRQAGLPMPDSYEMGNSIGAVIAEAELAWPDRRIAMLLDEQHEFEAVFKQQDWKIFYYNEAVADPQGVLKQIKDYIK
jgi:DEAD/DEAH box helicase domain-containing protein